MTSEHKTNRLIDETSPYLLQHAYNPVDWYPWGEAALEKAKKENKPIFLSVGYSACHWCHVMEHESFEDEEVGELLNQHFVSIKVDREERPDIDDIYMTAVQALTGSGGWPMSVFLTPEGKPFYAGTYYPKHSRQGMPGFMDLVTSLGNFWKKEEASVLKNSDKVVEHLKALLNRDLPQGPVPAGLLAKSVETLESDFDSREGGFGGAPKFPSSMSLDLYVDRLFESDETIDRPTLSSHLALSLRKMAQGGMYDQVGGGFHRYSTDEEWFVPHFEKMLYDNALLAKTYYEASQVCDREFNLRIASEILDYVTREMRHEQGAFFSTTDADSEGLEGKFFLWTKEQVAQVLDEEESVAFCDIYDIQVDAWEDEEFHGGTPPHHWFSGRIPHLGSALEEELSERSMSQAGVDTMRKALWQEREKRIHPGRDEKVLSSWNGLMSCAYVTGYRMTGKTEYLEIAKANIDFIWTNLQKDSRLNATWKEGRARHMGTLEDYANVAQACLELHRAFAGKTYLERAEALIKTIVSHFIDEEGKAFYYVADDAENLIVRSKNPYDNAVPGANSVLAGCLSWLGHLTSDANYLELAEGIFRDFSSYMTQSPRGFSRSIREAHYHSGAYREWVLVGASAELKSEILLTIRPSDLLLSEADGELELLKGKMEGDGVRLYVCTQGQCERPLEGEQEIREHLQELRRVAFCL